jgi:hypothetical protein
MSSGFPLTLGQLREAPSKEDGIGAIADATSGRFLISNSSSKHLLFLGA